MRLLALVLLAALAATPQVAAAKETPQPRQTFSVGPSTSIRFHTSSKSGWWGRIAVHIVGWNKSTVQLDRATAQADTSGVTTNVTQSKNTLEITTSFHGSQPRRRGILGLFGVADWGAVSVTYDVRIPTGSKVSLSLPNGDATIKDVHGSIDGSTSNGDLSVTGASGQIDLRTSNGDIAVALGALSSPPAISLSTSNGDIRLAVPAGFNAKVKTSTANGKVVNPFQSGTGRGDVSLSTSNGDITLTKE